ncbi:hypothetical protein PROCH_0980 [Prochlorococcus marinus str. EQPAC1]|nr:hypothetical protein PROCH_0980 [Prochlorococcus marinus str. EQPAC1]
MVEESLEKYRNRSLGANFLLSSINPVFAMLFKELDSLLYQQF